MRVERERESGSRFIITSGVPKALSRSWPLLFEATQKPSGEIIRDGPLIHIGLRDLKHCRPECLARPSGVIRASAFFIAPSLRFFSLTNSVHARIPLPIARPVGDIFAIVLLAFSFAAAFSSTTVFHCMTALLTARPSGVIRPMTLAPCDKRHFRRASGSQSVQSISTRGSGERRALGWQSRG